MIGPEVALVAPIGTVVEPGLRNGNELALMFGWLPTGARPWVPPPPNTPRAKWQCKLPEQPVKAHFLEIVLCHLEELGLDLHLAWWRRHLRFDERIDKVEICLGILDDQPAGAGNEVGARTGREGYPLSLQKLSRTRSSLNGGLRARSNRVGSLDLAEAPGPSPAMM